MLYVGVGSNSNITENGIEAETNRAAIWEVDRASGRWRIFASGLRNPNGLSFEPESGALWTVVNERDELGPNLVPDYLTSVKDGGFYGWPYSYYGQYLDPRVFNLRYGPAPGGTRFLLLHRRRVWNEGKSRWIGWERKRGKLHEIGTACYAPRPTPLLWTWASERLLSRWAFAMS